MNKRKPSKDFETRLNSAKRWRNVVEDDIRECLRFCCPPRADDFSSNNRTKGQAETTTFISIGESMAEDLAGDLVNYYMPSEERWLELEATDYPEQYEKEVLEILTQREDVLFEFMDASNMNDVKAQIMFEAATHGTPAVWMQQGHFTEPMYVEVVPPNELFITPGYLGYLDRFRETYVLTEHLAALLPQADLSHPNIRKKLEKPGTQCKVTWGYWLDWSEPASPQWLYECTVDDHRVTDERVNIGPLEGSCPLIVGRFNPQPRRPWGRGPGLKALPDMLTLDKIEEVIQTRLDDSLDPAYSYVHDGITDMSDGILAGMAYPRRAGSEPPVPIAPGGNLDYGFYTREEMEERIRVLFYQDGPRQRGDTPPTASQWVDERRRVQQRLGKPSAPLFTELLIPMMQRAEYLAVMAGKIEEQITVNNTVVNARPRSQLQKSQNQDKAMVARSNLQLAAELLGPEAMAQIIDPVKTFTKITKATGDELTQFVDQPKTPPAGPGSAS